MVLPVAAARVAARCPGFTVGMAGLRSHATKARSIAVAALVATYVLAIGIAGLWLVLPWWLPFAYGAVVVWTIARQLRAVITGRNGRRPPRGSW